MEEWKLMRWWKVGFRGFGGLGWGPGGGVGMYSDDASDHIGLL